MKIEFLMIALTLSNISRDVLNSTVVVNLRWLIGGYIWWVNRLHFSSVNYFLKKNFFSDMISLVQIEFYLACQAFGGLTETRTLYSFVLLIWVLWDSETKSPILTQTKYIDTFSLYGFILKLYGSPYKVYQIFYSRYNRTHLMRFWIKVRKVNYLFFKHFVNNFAVEKQYLTFHTIMVNLTSYSHRFRFVQPEFF